MSTSALATLLLVLKDRILKGPKTKSQKAGLFAILSFLFLVLKYPNRAIGTRARPDLDGIAWGGMPIIGNTYTILKNRNKFLQSIVENFEKLDTDVMSTTVLGLGRVIAINDPVNLEHIMKTNFENYEKGYILNSTMSQVLGNGIFNSDGSLWRMHRKTASHVFSTKIYRALIDGAFTDHSLQLCAVLDRAAQAGKPVDLQALFLRLTLDAFAKLSFGLDIDSLGKEGQDTFGSSFDYAVVATDERFMNPFWRVTEHLTTKAFNMKKAVQVVDSYAYNAIKGRRSETAAQAQVRQGPSGREDLLDLFMKWRDDDGRALSDVELRDVFINFIIAGRDTTAQALSWMYYEVMRNPAVERNIWQEVDKLDERPTYEMLTKDMRYSNAVFLEALRLYPPVPRNLKTAVADDVLPGGIKVQAGDRIMFSTYAIGRNKKVWGPQAPEFLPERWFEGNSPEIEKGTLKNSTHSNAEDYTWPKVRKESTFKFSSFNAGPRICLGQTFATLEALTVIMMISSKFKFELVPGQDEPEPVPSLTLPMKNPLLVNVHRRH
ncbi:cytochrome P450 [Linnemannia elongata]|nr:cytochrome P450 [Linnemannia elongata]